MAQLTDLPPNVLQSIFNYVPNGLLLELLDIPAISDPVAGASYSRVYVDKHLELGASTSYVAKSAKSDMATMTSRLSDSRRYHQVLTNAEVALLFNGKSNTFCMEYAAFPFPVTSLVNFNLKALDERTAHTLGKYVKSLNGGVLPTWTKLAWFPNLSSLQIDTARSPSKTIEEIDCQFGVPEEGLPQRA
ncbi:hypothetical protein Cantr_03921 [Candida viswanathii]|uniref:Uncharacterized protein n=1 Tax=Candida viswanathii TaxID=5486 RepID=A0A367XPF2_9ASCO|nr:hypothetical protein Cantr_03921 [Candida viswanathii]